MNNLNTAMLPDANTRILAKMPKYKLFTSWLPKKTINLQLSIPLRSLHIAVQWRRSRQDRQDYGLTWILPRKVSFCLSYLMERYVCYIVLNGNVAVY
jgi:hypothetical protein